MIRRISVPTKARVELRDITDRIQAEVEASNVERGLCYVFVPHTTAGITLNERVDQGVVEDLAVRLEAVAPQHTTYHHTEGNAPAHVKGSLLGHSEVLFIEDARLVLGTWQGVFLCEFDGARDREVIIKIVADKG